MDMLIEQVNTAGDVVGQVLAVNFLGGQGISAQERSDIAAANTHRDSIAGNVHGETPASIGADPVGSATAAVDAVKGAVSASYDTLEKIEAKLVEYGNVLQSDDLSLDEVQEIVDYINTNAGDIAALVSGKVDKASLVDNLLSTFADKVLSANQGRVLKGLIDGLAGQLGGHTVATSVPAGAVFTDTETLTSLDLTANILSYVDENGVQHQFDLSLYLDDTNLARLVSGTIDGVSGIATFTRDDATTFTVDFSGLLSGLGTAAAKDVQTSILDATAGRLLTVGAFGLGDGTAFEERDANTQLGCGTYACNSSSANIPIASNGVLDVKMSGEGVKRGYQLFNAYLTGALYFRIYNGAWQKWIQIYHQDSILGTVSQSEGVPTGAIIERGSNANGDYVKFADGTLICTNSNSPITTNPAAFVGAVTDIDGSKLRIGRWF